MTFSRSCQLLCLLLCCSSTWGLLSLGNETPLHPSESISEGKVTSIKLDKNTPIRRHFTIPDFSSPYSVTVTPCDVPIQWKLSVRKLTPWILPRRFKPSIFQENWKNPDVTEELFSYQGNAVESFESFSSSKDVYTLELLSIERDTEVTVLLLTGDTLKVFPEVPSDPRVEVIGVGMNSVTLSWKPSPTLLHSYQQSIHYCLLVNRWHNFKSLCAAEVAMRKRKKKGSPKKTVWWLGSIATPGLQHPALMSAAPIRDNSTSIWQLCTGTENVYTVSDLTPDTQYYFDIFVVNKLYNTSVAYTGTFSRTLQEPQPVVMQLRDSEIRQVNLQGRKAQRQYSFRPRNWQQRVLFTFQTCSEGQVFVKISNKGQTLASQVINGFGQILLQGKSSYLLQLDPIETLVMSLKMQATTKYHKRDFPQLPKSLKIKAFSKLRTCNSVTLAWLATHERSKYCVYKKKLPENQQLRAKLRDNDRCIGPDSRKKSEKVLCKYFQELNPLRAVTTATIGELQPGTSYLFDVYLIGHWGIPLKYDSKVVKSKKEC
ncbi:protein NDNF [Erpetoichthys calabaricus]|uniref:protein NDNF n=1 Tax=Erpetoichthys calabaricus TaxID=27687 RepID=UPI00223474B1|nr:protein NDNF [Erpetoichthys calabaricus]